MSTYEELYNELKQYDQTHLLKYWDELTKEQQVKLTNDIKSINFKEVTSFFKTATQSLQTNTLKLDEHMKPIPSSQQGSVTQSSPSELNVYETEGLQQISDNHVGVLLMAGGQGTRLGVTHPKGMYDLNLPSRKTLFQIQAERIIRLQELAEASNGRKGVITWYIMTSEHTMERTSEFFAQHNYFGLDKNNIVMFQQGLLPCFDFDGHIIMDGKFNISQAPDGNGGIYRALRDEGILADMRKKDVRYIHAHSVDNILVKVADPVFIGYCVQRNADCAAKVVQKTSPTEAVGVVCIVDNLYRVVEYSEITEATAKMQKEDGSLVFNAGNICNHFFSVDFLHRVAEQHETELKLHVAKKKIPYIDDNGLRQTPKVPNGIKIEKFVFDVFEFTEMFVAWEVERDVEFSALKNADAEGSKDCPRTARNDLFSLHRRYITKAGGIIEGEECEISPLLSYAGENLKEKVFGKKFQAPVLLVSEKETK